MRPLTLAQVDAQLTAAIVNGDPDEIDRLGTLAEKLADKPAPQLLPSALWYASVGLYVFPLTPMSKVPLPGFKWRDRATTDADQIRTWWSGPFHVGFPPPNIAIATGHLVDVIDIDGPVGVQSWLRMTNLPPVYGKVSTPRPGGNHLYVEATGRGNKAKILPGVDHRGLGGYVVAPPSVTDQGTYQWYVPLHLPTDDLGGDAA